MPGELDAVVDLFAHPGFQRGLVTGLLAGIVLSVAALITRRRAYGWGVLFAGAVVVGLYDRISSDPSLLPVLVGLAGSGLVIDLVTALDRRRAGEVLSLVAWIPLIGAGWWFGTLLEAGDVSWIPPVASLTVVAVTAGLWAAGRSPVAALVGPVFAVVVAGTWVTVPETDMMAVVVGVALPLGLVTLPPVWGRPLALGAASLAGVFTWLVVQGGLSRPWTVAGSLAGAAIIPLVAAAIRCPLGRGPQLLVVTVAALYVLAVTRVADYTESPFVVAASGAVLGAAAFAALWLIRRRAHSNAQ